MLRINAFHVYSAQHETLKVEPRRMLMIPSHIVHSNDIYHPVTGLEPDDLAIFGDEILANGMRDTQDWLVTDYGADGATLVNTTPLLEDPAKYSTPHLEMLVRRIGPIEASELGIGALISYIYDKK